MSRPVTPRAAVAAQPWQQPWRTSTAATTGPTGSTDLAAPFACAAALEAAALELGRASQVRRLEAGLLLLLVCPPPSHVQPPLLPQL